MKKFIVSIPFLLFLLFNLSGCNTVDKKSANVSLVYIICAVLSACICAGYLAFVKKKSKWFIVLMSSVLVVNIGYSLLSISHSLQAALMANRISYLGSVFLPLCMLVIILKITNTAYNKRLISLLVFLAIVMFAITASPGISTIYYKHVSLETVGGVSKLIKIYGPLHKLYLFYLIGYFSAMVAIITSASIKKLIKSAMHSIVLVIAVFVNIGVWFIEQIVEINFEMLSISYIISVLFLLGIHLAINENQKLQTILNQVSATQNTHKTETDLIIETPISSITVNDDNIQFFVDGIKNLTSTEKLIFDAYTSRVTSQEIMSNLKITENTLKFHNKNIYSKLGVSSRKELLESYKIIKSQK